MEQTKMNIYQKIQRARVLLQQRQIKKSGENKYSGFKYFELPDFMPAINNIFDELGLFSIINYDEKESTLTIYNCDEPNEQVLFNSPNAEIQLKGCHAIQNVGAVETYQRRYLYMTALEIAENDTLDAIAGKESTQSESKGKNNIVICDNCGKEITPNKGYTVEKLIEGSMNKYGKKLCYSCCMNLKRLGSEEQPS